jgi:flagellar hook assembly protein FlgD
MAVFPKMFGLWANYPNPFRTITNIRFEVPAKANVSLVIYNLQGRVVRKLINRKYQPGSYRVMWDGKDDWGRYIATGPYLYRLSSGKYSKVKMMMLVK